MDTTAIDTHNGPRLGPAIETITMTGRSRVDRRRGAVRPWQRLVAVIWDSQFLRVQHAVYRAAPRLAARMDDLARRRDGARREHR